LKEIENGKNRKSMNKFSGDNALTKLKL